MKKLFGIFLFISFLQANAQYTRFDSYSIYGGYAFLKTDFGARNDWDTNLNNTGIEVGGKIYYNLFPFYWRWGGVTHLRFNFEFMFATGKLEHIGRWTKKETPETLKLKAMYAEPIVAGLGISLEYSLRDIEYYNFTRLYGIYKFNATPGISLMAVYYDPNVYSTLGDITDPVEQQQILFHRFIGKVYPDPGITLAAVFKLTFTYQFTDNTHIFLENRATWFLDDKIDGLDVNDDADKYTDWIYTPALGLTFIIW